MSKFVDEIIEDIRLNPDSYKDISRGIEKGKIRVSKFGNSAVLSLIDVHVIDGMIERDIPLSYKDRYRLEKTLKHWYRTVSLNTIKS